MKSFICYNAGCDIYEVEPFNSSVEWHHNEFKGTYEECYKFAAQMNNEAYLFNNCLPATGNEDSLMNYHY